MLAPCALKNEVSAADRGVGVQTRKLHADALRAPLSPGRHAEFNKTNAWHNVSLRGHASIQVANLQHSVQIFIENVLSAA